MWHIYNIYDTLPTPYTPKRPDAALVGQQMRRTSSGKNQICADAFPLIIRLILARHSEVQLTRPYDDNYSVAKPGAPFKGLYACGTLCTQLHVPASVQANKQQQISRHFQITRHALCYAFLCRLLPKKTIP